MIMANLHLVTGYAGEEHITSNDQGSFNAALMGTGEFVLERGKQFEAQVISNNKVRIFDGDLLMQGRHIRLKEDTYVDLFFENGMQGYKRTDLIAVRYEKDSVTNIESASLVVIKGVPTEDAYVSPEKITGDIISEHALQNDTLLYKVNFDGLGIQEPEKVFSTVPTLETMKRETIGQIKEDAEKAIQDMSYAVDELIPLFGSDSPTPETQGRLKQFFVNTENGELFVCTEEGETYTWIKIGGGLGGVPLSDCKNLALKESNDKLTLTWTDPENVVFNGETIAEWEGTKVVRKEGGNPVSVEDGVLVADSKVKDQYAVEGLQDTDVVADMQYNYALFPYTAKNVYTMSDLNRISGSLMSYDPVLANNTWAQISEASIAGIASELWNLGDEKNGCAIIGFDHDDLADGSGKAGITFVCNNGNFINDYWYSPSTSSAFYEYSSANLYLDLIYKGTKEGSLSEDVRSVMKKVRKECLSRNNSKIFLDCYIFLFSAEELQLNKSVVEGKAYEGKNFIQNVYRFYTRTKYSYDSTAIWTDYMNGEESSVMTTKRTYRYGFCV